MLDTGGTPYLALLGPGVLAQSVLFIAIFNGISAIWERDLGIINKFLASPTTRPGLVLGKALGGECVRWSRPLSCWYFRFSLGYV